jgi:hypothetical protein
VALQAVHISSEAASASTNTIDVCAASRNDAKRSLWGASKAPYRVRLALHRFLLIRSHPEGDLVWALKTRSILLIAQPTDEQSKTSPTLRFVL